MTPTSTEPTTYVSEYQTVESINTNNKNATLEVTPTSTETPKHAFMHQNAETTNNTEKDVSDLPIVLRPSQPILVELSHEEIHSLAIQDDFNFENMANAIEQSLRFYHRLPDQYEFSYGKDALYNAKEIKDSMNLFLEIINQYTEQERIEQILQKFRFFESKNTKEQAFFTGYYEPILEGSLNSSEKYTVPLYERPHDLIHVDLGDFRKALRGEKVFGKLQEGQLVPYDEREEISYEHSLVGRAKPIAYVENHIELFFLQIQGSGLIQLRDQSLKRVNYASQNGREYKAIGRILTDKIPLEQMSLQTIKEYLYAHPEEIKRVLSYNPSYTFFREVEEGPLGYIEVPLTPERSIAMDHRIIPRGTLAFVQTNYPSLNGTAYEELTGESIQRFVLVQDTGGAIRGHGRVDIFYGNGEYAEAVAGNMKQTGRVFLLVAKKEYLHTPAISHQLHQPPRFFKPYFASH